MLIKDKFLNLPEILVVLILEYATPLWTILFPENIGPFKERGCDWKRSSKRIRLFLEGVLALEEEGGRKRKTPRTRRKRKFKTRC